MKLTLQQAKDRFASTGNCNHDNNFEAKFTPYGCDIMITQCTVCGEIKKKVYLNLT